MLTRLILTCVTALLLAGCGYQLKGQFRFADELSPLVWQSDVEADELYQEVRETFSLYGLVVGTAPADTLLQIHSLRSREVGLSEVTLLSLEVEWSLVNAYGVTLIDHRLTRSETRLSLSPEVDEDEMHMEREAFLRNRVALRILDQLEAFGEADLERRPSNP